MLRGDVDDLAATEPAGVVALLPAFDQYVVAAPREDSPVLPAALKGRVYRSQGWLSPVLLVDGRIEGVWRHERIRIRLAVTIEPFGDVSDALRAGAEAEARRLAAFLGNDEPEISWA
jgi:hypothetical protein